MELVIKNYGRFLLEVMVLLAFLILLCKGISDAQGNVGVFAMAGTFLEKEPIYSGSDFASCIEEGEKSAPQINFIFQGPLCVGKYAVSELFSAVDADGTEVPVQIQKISGPQGMLQKSAFDEQTGQIDLTKSGIYTFWIRALDAGNRTQTCKIRIPVNGEG